MGSFLACGDNYAALRDTSKQGTYVCWLNNLEKFVRSIILQSTNRRGCVVKADAFLFKKWYDTFKTKRLFFCIHEIILVVKEDNSLYAPVVVDEVGIVEVHAPALPLWRETAQKEHTAVLWQKRVQRMKLYPIDGAGNVIEVEEGGGGIHFR